MVILALETATRAGSVAMLDETRQFSRAGESTRTHSERLPGELFEFLAQHGRRLDDVDFLAVVTGPGSFTGLRIGIAAVQGIAMVTRKAVIPVPTLDAIARAWTLANPARRARLVTCLDGARGDVFFAGYSWSGGPANELETLAAADVAAPSEAAARVAQLPGDLPMIVVGDGAVRYRDVFSSLAPGSALDLHPLNLALGAAVLAADRMTQAVPPHALRPMYVRRPDAILARERLRAATGPSPVTIGRATSPEELAAVADLQRRSFANAWGAEAIRWEFDHSQVARLYTARTSDGSVVAYCACWLVFDELHINSVAVAESARRQGLARRVLDYVLEDAVRAGARSATLEVRQSNEAARALYEGLGFRVEGVRRNYYQNPREDALILWHRELRTGFGRKPPD